jgi:hypothetical protein
MGGHPYWYFVPYQKDLQQALDCLREREFKAGRYSPVIRYMKFAEPEFSRQTPGAQHESIEAVLDASTEEGTRSILDITSISDEPDYCAAAPLEPARLKELYGTTRPTREMIEGNMDFLDSVERGKCAYIVLYNDENPTEICFAGYSFD